MTIAALFVFIFGLLIGSFFNAVVWRFLRKERITGAHSQCVHCGHTLRAADLIPLVSFFLLRGKCRYCRKPIPWHYPVVEAVTGLVLLPPLYIFGLTIEGALVIIFVLLLLLLFLLDLRYSLLPDAVTLPGILVGVFVGFFVLGDFGDVVLGGILGGVFFWVQYLVSRGTWIGSGDIRLGAMMGFALGWQLLLLALFISYIGGAIIGVALLLTQKKGWKSSVPFGTFLGAGTYFAILWGPQLLDAYSAFLVFR